MGSDRVLRDEMEDGVWATIESYRDEIEEGVWAVIES